MANVTANFHAETVTELYTTTGQFVNVIEPDVEADHTIVLPMDLNTLFQQLPLSRVPIDDTSSDDPCELYRLQHGALCKATKVDKRASYSQAQMADWGTKFDDVDAVLTYQPVRGDGWTVCTDENGQFVRLADADAATIEVDRPNFIAEQLTRLFAEHDYNAVLELDSGSWNQDLDDIRNSVKEIIDPNNNDEPTGEYECKKGANYLKIKFNSVSGAFAYTSIEILAEETVPFADTADVAAGTLSIQYPSPNFIREVKKLGVNTAVDFDSEVLAVYAKFDSNARVGNAFRIKDMANSVDIEGGAVPLDLFPAVVTERSCDQYGSDASGVAFGDRSANPATGVAAENYTLEEHHRTFNVLQESPPQAEMNEYNRILVVSNSDAGFGTGAAQTKYSHELLEHMGSESLLETGLVLEDTDRPYCMPIKLGDYLYVSSKQLSSRPVYDSRRFLDYCAMAPTNGSSTTSTDITVDFGASPQTLTNSWQLPEDRTALERGLDELKYGHEANIRIKQYSGSSGRFQWGKTRHSEASEDREADPTFTTKVTAAIKDLFKVDDNEEIRVRFNPDKVADYVSSEAINKISCGVFTGVQMREILDACIQFGRINQKSTLDGTGSPDKHEGFRLHLNEADKIGVTVRLFGSTPETEQGITVRIWLEQLAVPEGTPENPEIPGPNNNEVKSMTYLDTAWQEFNSQSDQEEQDKSDAVYKALKMIQDASDSVKEGGQDILYTHAKVHGGLSEAAARTAAENAARGDISS